MHVFDRVYTFSYLSQKQFPYFNTLIIPFKDPHPYDKCKTTKVAWKASRGLVEILTDGTARIKGGGTEILTASYKNVSRDIQIVIKGTDSIDDINVGSEEGDNLWRNLNGQVVATPTHGIYIRNGKKIIVR